MVGAKSLLRPAGQSPFLLFSPLRTLAANVPDENSFNRACAGSAEPSAAADQLPLNRYDQRRINKETKHMSEHRVEHDSMGNVNVPARAYYGAQTQRAVENFPISGTGLPPELIHALGLVKWAAAIANRDLGKLAHTGKNRLDDKQIEALLTASREVA